MANLRNMFFDPASNSIYVADGDTNLYDINSYGHIRQFNADSGSYTRSFGGVADVLWTNAVAVVNGYVFATGKQPGGPSGLMNMSSGIYTNRAVLDQAAYGLTVANNQLFMAYDNFSSVAVFDSVANVPSVTLSRYLAVTNFPTGLAYDPAGYVYVTHNNAGIGGQSKGITKIKIADYSVSPFASSNLFNKPNGIAVRLTPREVYVVNTGTTEILKITTDGNGGYIDVSPFPVGKLCSPVGIAVKDNNLFIANGICTTANKDYSSTILKIVL
jgi:hypothetical protein